MGQTLEDFSTSRLEGGIVAANLPEPDGITRFQVIGERCSGTNFLTHLTRSNLDIPSRNFFGWKHGFPHFAASNSDIVMIVCVRNALAWIKSLYRKPFHSTDAVRERIFPDFIRMPFETHVDRPENLRIPDNHPAFVGQVLQHDRHPITGELMTPMRMRAAKLAAYRGLLNRGFNVVLVNYDKVSADPEAYISAMSQLLSAKRTSELVVPDKHLGTNWKTKVSRKHPAEITDADLEFILSELCLEDEAFFGFSYR